MAEENPKLTVEAGAESQTTFVSFDNRHSDGKVTTPVESYTKDATEEALSPEEEEALSKELEGEDPEPGTEEDGEEGTGEDADKEETGEDDAEALPDFDPEVPEVLEKYDAKYMTEDADGSPVLNFDAFNAELAKNYAEGKLDINAGSRKYLKAQFGISDALIDRHLAGLKAEADAQDAKVYAKVGGEEAYNAMLAWAETGYTPAQKARFNEAMKAGGDAREEQLDLLKARSAGKVVVGNTKDTPAAKRPGFKERRPSSPKATATGSTQQSGPKAFESSEEHRVAQAAAVKSGDPKKIAEVHERLKASTFWKGKK